MTNSPSPIHEPWRPTYRLDTLMLVMLVLCLMASQAYYMFKIPDVLTELGLKATGTPDSGRRFQLALVILTSAGPGILLTLASLARAALDWKSRT